MNAVQPRLFTSNGSPHGAIIVADTAGFRTKQVAYLLKTATPPLPVQVKRVLSPTMLIVGLVDNKIASWTPLDVSAYTVASGASIGAEEQNKNNIPGDDHYRAIYESDPVVADRAILVDKYGQHIDNIVDNNGVNRLAVDGQFHAEVDVQVDVDIDGFYDPSTNPDPDNIGLIGHTRSNPTNQTHQVQRQTAKRGTTDTDTVSADVAIHDHEGNRYDQFNPLPVTGSFEKFFELIVASKWMELANYDEVIPTYSAGNTILTLAYKEDGALLGEAVITYTSLTTWSLKLNRYIDDDDGTVLQDDDDTALNLD